MDQAKIQAELASLKNISAFARASKIPRRTLERLKAGERDAHKTTLMLVAAALKRLKPARKDCASEAGHEIQAGRVA